MSYLLEQQLRVLQDLASSDNWVDDKVDQAPIDVESRALHFVRYLIHLTSYCTESHDDYCYCIFDTKRKNTLW